MVQQADDLRTGQAFFSLLLFLLLLSFCLCFYFIQSSELGFKQPFHNILKFHCKSTLSCVNFTSVIIFTLMKARQLVHLGFPVVSFYIKKLKTFRHNLSLLRCDAFSYLLRFCSKDMEISTRCRDLRPSPGTTK